MEYSTTKYIFLSVLPWKIRFVQVSSLTWNLKMRLFVRFTVKNQLCASAKSDFKLNQCDKPS